MGSIREDTSSTAGLDRESYDYVVVGGGTSGLVVARRLTDDDPSVRVLVLEAGANRTDDPRIYTPGLASSSYWDPEFDWSFTSLPQKQLDGRIITHSMGKTLGGSSAINQGMAIFPAKANFASWEALGNPGWRWEDVAPYFRKFHTFTGPSDAVTKQLNYEGDPALQGIDGPIQISFGSEYMPFQEAWVPTFQQLNCTLTADPITGVSSGPFASGATVDPISKTRSHAGVAYYSPEVAERSNLRVTTEAFVEKVNLGKEQDGSVTARGVQFSNRDGQRHQVTAEKEIILAAGAFNTPQLLEVSGIGSKHILKAHGVDVLIDNPGVGENLQDHPVVPFNWEVAEDQISGDIAGKKPEVVAAAMQAYESSKTGPLSQVPVVSSFLSADGLSPVGHTQLLDTHVSTEQENSPAAAAQHAQLRRILETPDEPSVQYSLAPVQLLAREGPLPQGIFGMSKDGMHVSIIAALNTPFSRGSTHINSADPSVKPVVDTGHLKHPMDVELLARHTLFLEKLTATDPMVSLLKPGGRRIHNYERPEPVADLDAARELAKELVISNYHTCGTCPMMPREIGGVVSERLVVHGTRNLRIVDASCFPLIPRGNIQSSVYAVAEKAADIIKEDSNKDVAIGE